MSNRVSRSFPLLPVSHWWALREKFKQSIPGTVTDNYLASALGISLINVIKNIRPYLKTFGLIDDDGKPLSLAKTWRDDKQYAEACSEIKKNVYPDELISAVLVPSQDRSSVESWFANQTGAGKVAVQRMTSIYITLSEADVSEKIVKSSAKKATTTEKKILKKIVKPNADTDLQGNIDTKREDQKQKQILNFDPPDIRINLEIHISSDASPDQIDQIFESMAKHIYKSKNP